MDDPYRPASFAREGFVHCSFRDDVAESARLYFEEGAELRVLQLDPRALTDVRTVDTPRGPMPHVHEAIPFVAVQRIWLVDQIASAPDLIG